MAAKKKEEEQAQIVVEPLEIGEMKFHLIGNSPFIFNTMSEKVKIYLLIPPPGKKTAADKAATLKHDPEQEFRDSASRNLGNTCATRLCHPTPAFKNAIASAALDMPGAAKTEIGRLSWVTGYAVDIYGIPKLLMSVVKMNNAARTPDVRTRAILMEWACSFTIQFARPKLTAQAMTNLAVAAGMIRGVGDFRQEKGKGSFGRFQVVGPDNPDYKRIVATGGRAVQDAALEECEPADDESERLLSRYKIEAARLGREPVRRPPPVEKIAKKNVAAGAAVAKRQAAKRNGTGARK
jgi:hypothetical protein